MRCKFCGEELDRDSKFCVKCGQRVLKNISVTYVCPDCGAEVAEEAKFCHKCGARFNGNDENTVEYVCPKCGVNMEPDAKFCAKCGYGLKKKSKRKSKKILVLIILFFIVAAISGTIFYVQKAAEKEAELMRQAEIKEFVEKSTELYSKINEAESNFSILSTMFSTSTEMNTGLFGADFFTSYVESLCGTEISQERSRKYQIDSVYEEWTEIECDEEEIKFLKTTLKEYYQAYEERYDLLVNTNFTEYTFDTKENISATNFTQKKSLVATEISKIKNFIIDEGGAEA